jgi:hypothetical protein
MTVQTKWAEWMATLYVQDIQEQVQFHCFSKSLVCGTRLKYFTNPTLAFELAIQASKKKRRM